MRKLINVKEITVSLSLPVEKNESTEIADELLASSSSFEKEPSPRKLIPRKYLDIEELWCSHHDGDRVESVFGNVVLKKKSLCLLQGSNWLDDIVIDAALEALCIENEDWNNVSAQYGTLWFHKGRFTSRNNDWVTARFMKPVVTMINTGAHWVFLAIDVTNAEVFIYDPLGREKTIAPTITTNLTWYTVDIWDFNVPNNSSRNFIT
ncbi:unnamed protein product [Clavelina lepadiformis]|uniref:Ubiquitin-like protease family profile domain-containing protein n=1 Tax=Clavelina lepadiformis TaxID=159417 RepID=A0ABP0GT26_CLALP